MSGVWGEECICEREVETMITSCKDKTLKQHDVRDALQTNKPLSNSAIYNHASLGPAPLLLLSLQGFIQYSVWAREGGRGGGVSDVSFP